MTIIYATISQQRVGGNVWQGEYGTVRIDVPNNALPGGGIARIFAYDDTYAAVGGTRFWVDTPVVQDIRETLDTKVTDTLNISALVLDDKGPGGIRRISVLWDDTTGSGLLMDDGKHAYGTVHAHTPR